MKKERRRGLQRPSFVANGEREGGGGGGEEGKVSAGVLRGGVEKENRATEGEADAFFEGM